MISPSSLQAVTTSSLGQVARLDHQRVVAGGAQRVGQARRRRPRRRGRSRDALPCIGRRARTICPPKAWPMHWWPRQTPRIGIVGPSAAHQGHATRRPRCGVQGPGEMTMCDRGERGDLVDRHRVAAQHLGRPAQLAHVARQVVDERVVVVDDHGSRREGRHRAPAPWRASPRTRRRGRSRRPRRRPAWNVTPPPADGEGADGDAGVERRRRSRGSRSRRSRGPRRVGSSSAMISIARIFGRAGDRAAGEARRAAGRPAVERRGAARPVTVETRCMHRREALERAQLGHRDAAVAADAREVVAQQVDDHHVLGAVLLAGRQLGRERVVLGRRAAPRGRVPLIGRVSTRSPSSRRKRSGDDEAITTSSSLR